MKRFNRAKEIFNMYTKSLPVFNNMCELKYKHTLRVVDSMEMLLESFPDLSFKMKEICMITALLHDIGRFEQAIKYNNFNDSETECHAALGIKAIKELDIFNEISLSEREQSLVLKSIEFHNKYKIPSNIADEELILISKLIRDADKLDIFYVYTKEDPFIYLGLEKMSELLESIISSEVRCCIIYHTPMKRELLKTKTDWYLSCAGLIFDLNFQKSFEIVLEKKYNEKLFDYLIDKDHIQKNQLLVLKEELSSWLKRREHVFRRGKRYKN